MEETAALLLAWYDRHARSLPWRGVQDPYRIWVSEIMLQQTRVETVTAYYDRFLNRFPTLAELAAAREEEVLKLWEGLGYYSRARNLWLGARQVMAELGGALPRDAAALRRIRGIGPYTAGAIASIAFQQPVPAMDGNVVRVLCRLRDLRENPRAPEARRRLETLAASLVPAGRPGDFNQAMMDLGAGVCVPGTPDCPRCPLRSLCLACAAGDAEELPRLPAARPPRKIDYDLILLFSGDRVLMRRRSEKLLQGLWCFPMLEEHHPREALAVALEKRWGFPPLSLRPAGSAHHVFTHLVWNMALWVAEAPPDAPAPGGYEWIAPESFPALALPTAIRAGAELVRERQRR